MPTTNQSQPGAPPHPAVTPPRPASTATLVQFGKALAGLRAWAGLTQKTLEGSRRGMSDSAISRFETGAALPALEWVHAYVTVCLTHRGITDPVRLQAELVHWRTAWTHARHHPGHPEPPPPADTTEEATPQPVGDTQPGAGDHEEAGQDPAGPPVVPPDSAVACPEQPPAAITVSGDSDPTTCTAVTDRAGGQLHQAATTPHNEPYPPDVTSVGHRRRWALGAAAVIVAAGAVVVVTTTGVLGNTNNPELNPPPLIPGKTYTETVHTPLGARTYSKPHAMSGEWRRIPNGTNVQVSCEVTVPSVPSVGLYWYRIANPPPWQNYYAPANSFLNGDPPDGSAPTHAVDQTVPECPH